MPGVPKPSATTNANVTASHTRAEVESGVSRGANDWRMLSCTDLKMRMILNIQIGAGCQPARTPAIRRRLLRYLGFGGVVTSVNARIASIAVGTPLYCET